MIKEKHHFQHRESVCENRLFDTMREPEVSKLATTYVNWIYGLYNICCGLSSAKMSEDTESYIKKAILDDYHLPDGSSLLISTFFFFWL